jgi:hypothetical protein
VGVFYLVIVTIPSKCLVFCVHGSINEDVDGYVPVGSRLILTLCDAFVTVIKRSRYCALLVTGSRTVTASNYQDKDVTGLGLTVARFIKRDIRIVGNAALFRKGGLVAKGINEAFERGANVF